MKERRFDVVLMDIKMPGGMDGIETFRELKKIQPLAEVIFLTGHATLESSVEGMKLGALDILLKPCETEDLVTKLKKAYERKSEHEERIRAAKVSDIISSPRSVLNRE